MKTFPWNNRETNNYKHRVSLYTEPTRKQDWRRKKTASQKIDSFLLHFSFGWMVFGEAVFCFDGGYELGSFGQTSSTETTTTVLHKRVAFVSLRNKKQFLILL